MDVTRDYQLPVGKTMRFLFKISNGKTISQKVGRKITECEIENIRSIVLKDSKTFGTTVLKIKFFDPKKGKEKSFMRLEGTPDDAELNRFIADLRELVQNPEVWDQSKKKSFKKGDRNVYDMQVTMMGYTGIGLPRKVQIWVIFGTLSLIIIPLPLFIYVLARKCFQIETDDKSIIIRKYKNNFFYWTDIDRVEVTRVNVRIRNEGVGVDEQLILLFRVYPKKGRRIKFKMRILEGKPFLRNLLDQNLIQISNEEKINWGLGN